MCSLSLRLDVLLGFSGLFAAVSIGGILVALFVALVIGGLVASFFGAIFFGMNRLAQAVSAGWNDADELRSTRNS